MSKIDLNALRDRAYKTACEHGFHDQELSNEHCLCLVISELMEAVEADRKGKRANVDWYNKKIANSRICQGLDPDIPKERGYEVAYNETIKGSIEEELADAVIRLLDLAGLRNLNLNRFALVNVVSKKKTFTENIYSIVKDITNYKYTLEELVNYAITQVFVLSDILEEAARENILFNHRTADRTLSGKNLAQFGEINFIQGAEWHAKQSPWISVEERLPDYEGKVLVLYEYEGEMQIQELFYIGEKIMVFGSSEVLAWMPIPSFDEILEANRDVLERIKEKGD